MQIQLAAQSFSLAHRHKLKSATEFDCVQPTDRANAAIAGEHLVAQVSGIRSQPPLVNTTVVAESSPAAGHFLVAPAAYASVIRTPFLCFADPAAGFLSVRAHSFSGRLFLM
jgi:hypothetical protein